VYVFENYSSKKIFIVSVVASDEKCSNSVNGVGASMVTEQALSEVGVQSQKKNVDPVWSGILLTLLWIAFFVFGIIGIIMLGWNMSQGTITILGKKKKKNTIYYDKLDERNKEDNQLKCLKLLPCCKKKITKVDNKEDEEKIEEIEPEKKRD